MRFLSFSSFGIAIFVLLIVVLLISKSAQADDCCPPPRLGPQAVRFQQNAQVTVYLNTTGLTDIEVLASNLITSYLRKPMSMVIDSDIALRLKAYNVVHSVVGLGTCCLLLSHKEPGSLLPSGLSCLPPA